MTGPLGAGVAAGRPTEQAELKEESRRKIAAKRILVWLLFGAVFGLMPLFAVMIKELLSPEGLRFSTVLNGGDLFIVSAVLSAGALGELLASTGEKSDFIVIISGFFCLACFAGNTLAFVFASNARTSEIVILSLWFFPATLLASASCVGTAAYS